MLVYFEDETSSMIPHTVFSRNVVLVVNAFRF